ncbi:MAG: MBL fold metallo-hydrolase, partial [Candidatus Brocadiia bacterium]
MCHFQREFHRLPDGLVMVDCATIGSMPVIERNIRRAGFRPDDVTDLILSHSHADHTEAAELWRTRHGLRTHLNEIGAVLMDREVTSLLGYVGEGQPLECAPFHVDHRVRDGEAFDVAGVTMTATCVPGHTLDSTLFTFEMNGRTVGISGDFVFGPANWNKEGGGLGAMRNLWKASLPDNRGSLERVLEMEIDVLLPGHGAAIVGREEVRRNLELALEA